jgi:Cytochrome b subunit of formate dehydrogenase
MGSKSRKLRLALGILAYLPFAAAFAEEIKDSACLDCHSDKALTTTNATGAVVSLFVDVAKLAASIHHTNTCASCHDDLTLKHPDDNIAARPVNCVKCHQKESESYGASVHGLAAVRGEKTSATCSDCHDGHTVVPPTSPDSPLHFSKLAQTCGSCHEQAAKDVAESVHGRAVAAGHREAPTCTDCHSGHKIMSLRGSAPLKISAEVCSNCHASERMNTKYNLPPDRVKTFFESYHGLAAQYGSTVAANCASCHGVHRILPSSDPRSTINQTHLVETCGKCHPGATDNFAQSKVHIDAASANAGAGIGAKLNWWVRRVYIVLIVAVIGGMLLHNGALFVKKVRARFRAANLTILRMNLHQRWQHAVLGLSFVVLAVTGFALKFPDSWIAKALGSNELFRRWAHRVAAIVMLGVGAWHLVYLIRTAEGRQLLRDFLPVKKDVADAIGNVRYLIGVSSKKCRFARFGYAEKMEYWAVIWGTIIMGVTGLMLWFTVDVTKFMPRWVVDIALTIHYYEAILACLAIVVWHFYHVIFDPDVYPVNWAAFNGKVSAHWQQEEHPLQNIAGARPPALVAREMNSAVESQGAGNGNGYSDKSVNRVAK